MKSESEKAYAPAYMLSANVWIVFMNIAYKTSWLFGGTLLLSLVFRNLGHFGINYIWMEFKRPKLRFSELSNKEVDLGLLRGFLSTLTSLFSAWAVVYLDFTEVQLIALTKPFLTMILNQIVFKDPLTKNHLFAFLVCFIGVVFVIQPSFIFASGGYLLTSDKIKGFVLRLISNLWNSLADMTIKQTGGKLNVHFIIHYMGLVNLLCFSVAFMALERPKIYSTQCYASLFLLGVFSYFTHFYYSKAYQFGKTNSVALMEFSSVLFSLIADYFLLGRTYNLFSYIGIIIIMSSLALAIKDK